MTLVGIWSGGEPEKIGASLSPSSLHVLKISTLCCDGKVLVGAGGAKTYVGDPTETAIVDAALESGMEKSALEASHPRLGEIPFDSDRKLMTTIHEIDGRLTAVVKGAFDVLTKKCIGGPVAEGEAINAEMAKNALRVIAVGYKHLSSSRRKSRRKIWKTTLSSSGFSG
jgi:Ca2+-transporting ATPase